MSEHIEMVSTEPLDQVTTRRRGARQGACATCKQVRALTFHHLIPKKLHRRRHFKRTFNKHLLAEGIYICRPCHDGIHRLFDEMTIAKHYASLSALLEDPALNRHFSWVAKQKVVMGG
ncbi:MAG: hypothetical protein ACO391_10180, partial [Pseudomonadales bacterium]